MPYLIATFILTLQCTWLVMCLQSHVTLSGFCSRREEEDAHLGAHTSLKVAFFYYNGKSLFFFNQMFGLLTT